jgi:HEAT repeat protein
VLAARGTQSDLAAVLAILQRADERLPDLLEIVGGASPVVRTGLPLLGSLLELRSHRDRHVRAAVARLLGRLGRGDAFTPLLDLLEDEDGGVRRAADAALRRLTGAAAASSSAAWKHWYDDEKAWLEQSSVSTLLRSEQPLEAARALREVGQHPFLGARHLSLVQRLVDHAAPGVRLLALTTLVRMNRADVVPDLIRHLNDGDAQVRAAVWKSLQRLSGEDLPGEYRAWSDASQRWRS